MDDKPTSISAVHQAARRPVQRDGQSGREAVRDTACLRGRPQPYSEDELRQLLRESLAGDLIAEEESQLSEAALTFGDLRAREVMQPRPDIDYVTTADPVEQVIETAMRTGRTRLPLVEHDGDLDRALGAINAKDLLPAALGQPIDLQALARPLPRVAEGTRVDAVLRDMRRQQPHLALVVDEHGTVIGLLTLEDVLEELVGEIDDEFDTATEQLIERANGSIRLDGAAPVRLVARELGVALDDPHESTLNGHVIETLGRVPHAGETIHIDGIELEVLAGDDAHVTQLQVNGAPHASRSDR